MRPTVLAVLLLLLAACDEPPLVERVCDRLCGCIHFFPSDQRACVDSCASLLDADDDMTCTECLDQLTCEDATPEVCGGCSYRLFYP